MSSVVEAVRLGVIPPLYDRPCPFEFEAEVAEPVELATDNIDCVFLPIAPNSAGVGGMTAESTSASPCSVLFAGASCKLAGEPARPVPFSFFGFKRS